MKLRTGSMVALFAIMLTGASARAEPPPVTVDLLTMGPGDRLFEVFGHAALCVGRGLSGDCYNYGVTDFQQSGMVLGFLRGEVPFWVEDIPYRRLLLYYQSRDREVMRQRLNLSPAQLARIVGRLRHDVSPEHRNYPYDHFRGNCTTKVRDVVDEALGGALHAATDTPAPPSFRALVRRGFAGRPLLEWLGDAMMGRTLDRLPTRWDAMFLPDALRREVAAIKVDGIAIAPVPADPLYTRKAPDPIAGNPNSGRMLGYAFAAVLMALGLLTSLRGGWGQRIFLALSGLLFGALGGIALFIAVVSTSPDLRQNEALIVLWFTDLWLVPGALLLSPRRPRLMAAVLGYARLRAAVALVATLLVTFGVLAQPFDHLALAILALMGGTLFGHRLRPPQIQIQHGGTRARREDLVSGTSG